MNKRGLRLPTKVRDLLKEILHGERKSVLKECAGKTIVSPTLAAALIKAELNYDIKPKTISNVKERPPSWLNKDIEEQPWKGPNWSPSESKRCKELFLKIPDRSDNEYWQKNILDILDEEFPVRLHTKSSVQQRMRRAGVLRTNTYATGGDIQPFEYFEAIFLEGDLELISHKTGTEQWIVKCLICGHEMTKSRTHSASHGCSGCAEDADTPSNLYETPVYSEIENRWTLKFGESVDPMGIRIPSFGITRAGKIWTYELYPQLTKYTVNVIERKMDKKFGLYKDPIPELIGNGHTECYHMSKRDLIIEYADQLVLDAKSEIPSK